MLKVMLRTQCKEGKAPLYTRIRVEDRPIWVNLQLFVDIETWNKASLSDRKLTNYLDRLDYNRKIAEIDFAIKDLRTRHRLTKETLEEVIKKVVLAEVREQLLKTEIIEKETKERRKRNVKLFVEEYIDGIVKGEILSTKGKVYAANSIKNWKQFKRLFLECYKNQSFTWEDLDRSLIHKFIIFLDKEGYMGETVKRFVGSFSTVITVSEKMKLHNNGIARKWLTTPTVTDDDRKARIYLTKEELKALYAMKLSGLKEVIRDWFLIGCYTSLRYDEFSKIEKGCVGITQKGTKVIRIKQGKVSNKVVIPIMCEELEILLEKYDYTAPKLCEQVMNRYLKKICYDLSKEIRSLCEMKRTLLDKKERNAEEEGKKIFKYDESGYAIKPRWELVVCHSVRRTCLTNMYLSGKYSIRQMMSVSGHKKEETFMRYIRLSLDEKADDVANAAADGLFE